MIEDVIVEIAVGLGVVLSLLAIEFIGSSAGGIVVPGYIAMHLHRPEFIVGTLIVALATWGVVRIISYYAFIYGKRRMVLSILIGFCLGYIMRNILNFYPTQFELELHSLGFIVPGLIANWFERQGFVKTISTMFTSAFLVSITLVILTGGRVVF